MTRAAWAALRRIACHEPSRAAPSTLAQLVTAGMIRLDVGGAEITDAGLAAVGAVSKQRGETSRRAPTKPRRVPPEKRVRPEYVKGGRGRYLLRLGAGELAEVKRRAREAGQTVSAYLRGRALDDGEGQP